MAADPSRLADAARLSPLPWVQRLGYLLEQLGATEAADALAAFVGDKAPHVTPLAPAAPIRGTRRDSRWKVAVNTRVDAEL